MPLSLLPTGRPRRRLRRLVSAFLLSLLCLLVVVPVGFRLAAHLRESKTRQEAAPGTGRFVRAGDLEIFVQEEGPADGAPVLLIHGTGAWSEIWRETMHALAGAGYRGIAIDLPPFGFSERPATSDYTDTAQAARIIGVLDALGLSSVTLVGHSFGARPTVEAAMHVPGRVRLLVLVDAALGIHPAAVSGTQPPFVVRASLSNGPVRNALVATTLTNPLLSRRLLQFLILDPADATDMQVAMLQQQFGVQGTTPALGHWLREFLLSDVRSLSGDRTRYRMLAMPTLVLWGRDDSITPLVQGEDLASQLPGAELVVLERTGHIPAIESAGLFNEALLAFLAKHGSAES